ncbi:interleukin-17C-like [Haliotis rufescens]|uniref:interleukin-17C-like n=1 Tax=Haliotis rufescens TaxID=6454 RepID=UPI001EB0A50C|nr:interleukin-17C-like [Haliotis rufescens]
MQLSQLSVVLVVIMNATATPVTDDMGNMMRARRDATQCKIPSHIQQIFNSLNNIPDTSNSPVSQKNMQDSTRERSICPWSVVSLRLGDNIYPQQLRSASCNCRDCINNNKNQCEQVKASFRVLKYSCENGTFTYQPEDKEVAVGCTCAAPRASSG